MSRLRSRLGWLISIVIAIAISTSACATSGPESSAPAAAATATPEAVGSDQAPSTESTSPDPPSEPQPFVSRGRVGDADAYEAMISELTEHVPVELRAEVPWPDLRHADPVAAQLDIFALWIWMLENHPEPRLIDAIAAPGSPDRVEVAGLFGEHKVNRELVLRPGAPYRAFDHEVVTLESAALPSWVTRDVPEPAVVVYYRDESGPSTVIDRDTGATLAESGATGIREWVAIMVEAEVGWLLWQDTEITPVTDFQFPEPRSPSRDDEQNSRKA